MVNAAIGIRYGKDFYDKGTKLPKELVEQFEIYNPALLDNYIQVNSTWQRIDSPNLTGFVKENKARIGRLIDYFKIKPEKPKEEKSESMLRVKEEPKPKPKYTGRQFRDLKRNQQEKILTKLGVSFSKKDKERDLIRKYLKNV